MTANNIAITAHSLKEYFKNGGVKTYQLFDVAEEFLEYHTKKTANCASSIFFNAIRKLFFAKIVIF